VQQKESDRAVSGNAVVPPVDTPAGALGLAVCYDLRFPELSQLLVQQGATVLAYPSAFTVPTGAVSTRESLFRRECPELADHLWMSLF
jgi:predicted amidohydrolase